MVLIRRIGIFIGLALIALPAFAQPEFVRPADFRFEVTVDADTVASRVADYKIFQDAVYYKQMNCDAKVVIHPLGIEIRDCFDLTEVVDTVEVPFAVYERMIETVDWEHRQSAPDEHVIELEITHDEDIEPSAWIEACGERWAVGAVIPCNEMARITVEATKDARTVTVRDSVNLKLMNDFFLSENMSQYFYDFGDIANNESLYDHGFTEIGGSARLGATVKTDSVGQIYGNYVEVQDTINPFYSRRGIKINEIDLDANRVDSEVLIRMYATKGFSYCRGGAMIRENSDNHYNSIVEVSWNLGNGVPVLNDVNSVLSRGTKVIGDQNWFYLRFRVNGSNLMSKVWLDGDPEPESWDVSITDATYTLAGAVGVYFQRASAFYLDFIGVGTGGDTAPSEPIDTGTTVEASYSAATSREVTKLSDYSAQTGRSVQSGADYSPQTDRTLNSEASNSASTERKITTLAGYTAASLRKVKALAIYSAATLRELISEAQASYSGATRRRVTKDDSYSASTDRKVTTGASYSPATDRNVIKSASYSPQTIRSLIKAGSYSIASERKVTDIAGQSPSTFRKVNKRASASGVTLRMLTKAAQYSGATLRTIRDATFVEFPAVVSTSFRFLKSSTSAVIHKFKTKVTK